MKDKKFFILHYSFFIILRYLCTTYMNNNSITLDLHPRITDKIERINL